LPCPPLALSVDLDYMIIEEGVIFANVPKPELTGITCVLLGLSNLKSSPAPPPQKEEDAMDKGDIARAVRRLYDNFNQ
jgi:hypothetical protein